MICKKCGHFMAAILNGDTPVIYECPRCGCICCDDEDDDPDDSDDGGWVWVM